MPTKDDGTLRGFDTGATRDTAEGKLDYEGFLSPAVLKQYARFMNMNRLQSDGKLRDSDNWQKGIPFDVYMKSGYRHFFEWWEEHRSDPLRDRSDLINMIGALCGLMFNSMGYLHELLKTQAEVRFDADEPTPEMKERQDKLKVKPEPSQIEYTHRDTCADEPCCGCGNAQSCAMYSEDEEQDKENDLAREKENISAWFSSLNDREVHDCQEGEIPLPPMIQTFTGMPDQNDGEDLRDFERAELPRGEEPDVIELCDCGAPIEGACFCPPIDEELDAPCSEPWCATCGRLTGDCLCPSIGMCEGCGECRWKGREAHDDPCKSCLLKAKSGGPLFSLFVPE